MYLGRDAKCQYAGCVETSQKTKGSFLFTVQVIKSYHMNSLLKSLSKACFIAGEHIA